MSRRTLNLTNPLYRYILDVSLREHPQLAALRAETAKMSGARMQIAPEQGQFMAMLIRLIGAKQTLEVGTFTGYSALAVALALADDGKVTALELDPAPTPCLLYPSDAPAARHSVHHGGRLTH